MANSDRPRGLRPYKDIKSEAAYEAAGTIYPGDAVTMNNAGAVVVATAAQSLCGVAAAYATSGNKVLVWNSPDQEFVVQADDGTTLAQTAIGLNYDIVATAGNSSYKQSRMELDSSSGATDSILPLRLLGVDGSVNEAIGEFAKCVVRINAHQLGKNTVGL